MSFLIYCIYDKVSGSYGKPDLFVNHATAERWFRGLCLSPDGKPIKADLDLYQLGTYDSETGEILPFDKPVFMINGGTIFE